jgi:hypothetical protein
LLAFTRQRTVEGGAKVTFGQLTIRRHCGARVNRRTYHRIDRLCLSGGRCLRVGHRGTPAGDVGRYELGQLPGVELAELFLTLARVGAHGNPRKPIKNGEVLGQRVYLTERAIDVPLAGFESKDLYDLRVGAGLDAGGTTTTGLRFYHSGE